MPFPRHALRQAPLPTGGRSLRAGPDTIGHGSLERLLRIVRVHVEATGGRAAVEMGELSQVLGGAAEPPTTPASFGEPAHDSYCRTDGVGDSRFGHGAPRARAVETHGNIATVDVEGVAGALHETTAPELAGRCCGPAGTAGLPSRKLPRLCHAMIPGASRELLSSARPAILIGTILALLESPL